ncbi:MAG: 50S ribosomal protein L25/general stress protein Ctc [Desulfobacterota bacterium]|nr:50S ribosomal protein L25/general stress protein Ctc [Thermodesulfobacteriota bacterium]
MTERPLLKAELREGTGKGPARKVRAKGMVPAIFYGPKTQSLPLIVDPRALSIALQTEAGGNVLIDLEIQNGEERSRRVVMVKDLQYDHFGRKLLHVDFYEVAMDVMITVEVPIHLVGRPEGTKMGGVLEQVRRTLEIQCLPGDIPKDIEIDVSPLKIGDSIHVRDVQLAKGRILSDPNLTIATVVPPVTEEKKAEEGVPEAGAAAEVKEKEAKEKKE